ncbi:MAG: C40 family peptidase [Lactobacillaceae bacterium]|jgi:cell wall-associated NlpC family hydrolase|nr:C40 family peptidase [Lactobacillaceae bacterium]
MKHKQREKKDKSKHRFLKLSLIISLLVIIAAGSAIWLSRPGDENIIQIKSTPEYFKVDGVKVKLQSINNIKYLYNAKTGKKLVGMQTLGSKIYYFNSTTGAAEFGYQKIDGYSYYFEEDGTESAIKAYQHVAKSLVSDNTIIEKVISGGMQLVGKSPYAYGGGRTDESVAANEFDCSSFVAYYFREAGLPLVYQYAASTTLLAQTGTRVAWDDMRRGDLLITPDDYPEERQHVAIYLGDGFVLHDASSTGGVSISRLNQLVNPETSATLTWEGLFRPGYVQREVDA